MLTKEAIEALSEAQSIGAAAQAVRNGMGDAVALPNCYTMHDLERFAAVRRRARGKMTTEALADFSAYVQAHAEAGATVFVNGATMAATAVLNLGTPQDPGHADNTAVYAPPKTAAYKALLATASGAGMPQQKAAEFFEDWLAIAALEFLIGDDPVPPPKAIAAVRAITIDVARKVEATEQSLGASRSAFESVQASSKHALPERALFTCAPHLGLAPRTFELRLGVLTSDKPQVVLRVVNAEQHCEDMAAELANLVRGAVSSVPVAVGQYAATA